MSPVIMGREPELGAIDEFLARLPRGCAGLTIEGEAGLGKTTLWQAAVQRAGESCARVLSHRAVEAESALSMVGLTDLLGGVLEETLPGLAAPRRRALQVVLLIEEPGTQPPDASAIGFAVLDVLRALARAGPVLVAIDDIQWLDASSAATLEFAMRRVADEPIGILCALRCVPATDAASEFRGLLDERRTARIELGSLDPRALHQILRSQLAFELSRPELLYLHDVTAGNPLFALELVRELERAGSRPTPDTPLQVPGNLGRLLSRRLARLPDVAREILLAAAALAQPTTEVLIAAFGDADRVTAALDAAAAEDIVTADDERVRFTHPLLASICYGQAPPWRRRDVHARLALAVGESEQHARHLALAAAAPDAEVAATLDLATASAAARGATTAAAALAQLAAALTPPDVLPARWGRLLRAADLHRLAGDRARASRILEDLVERVPGGAERADVLFALATVRHADLPTITKLCERALEQVPDDDERFARIVAFLSWMRLLRGDVVGALADARAGLARAERVGDPELVARAIARVAMAETWALDMTPGLVERGVELELELGRTLEFHESPVVALGRRLICLGEFDSARDVLHKTAEKANAAGDEGTRGHVLFHLILVDWFAGRWTDALDTADAALELAEQLNDDQYRGMVLHARAIVEAHMGRDAAARVHAAEADALARVAGDEIFPIWNAAILGHLDLARGDVDAASRRLGGLPGRLLEIGWNDPADPIWADAIESLVATGDVALAQSYLERYADMAHRSASAWALAIAARCRGLLAAAAGDVPQALAAFDGALADHARTAAPFERARTLLVAGAVRRRARQKRPAREALEQARVIFEELGAVLWAQRARSELARIGGRRTSDAVLTEAEVRVATLAVAGRSNKEIAAALVISIHTVEAHLTRVYRKLEIRSRSELAASGHSELKV